jgi:hypothetical protein
MEKTKKMEKAEEEIMEMLGKLKEEHIPLVSLYVELLVTRANIEKKIEKDIDLSNDVKIKRQMLEIAGIM